MINTQKLSGISQLAYNEVNSSVTPKAQTRISQPAEFNQNKQTNELYQSKKG
jgi:hypothetical protein